MRSLLRIGAQLFGSLLWTAVAGSPQADAQTVLKSGYALTDQRCGEAPDAYPKLRIGLREGYCAGLVASEEDGLIFPRSIVQIPGHRQFVIADMGSWNPGQGRLLLLDPDAAQGKRISVLIGKLDFPFGLQVGPDGKVYASTSQTIFRFDPLASNPKSTIETVIRSCRAGKSRFRTEAWSRKAFIRSSHSSSIRPGGIFVNVGAPTDSCLKPISKPCVAGEGAAPFAAIWLFTPPPGGIFPALKPGDPNPVRDIYARGLAQLDGAGGASRFPGRRFCIPAGRKRPRSAGSAGAERGDSTRSKRASITAGPIATTFRRQARNSSRSCRRSAATGISAPTRRCIASRFHCCRRTPRRWPCCITAAQQICGTEGQADRRAARLSADRQPRYRLRRRRPTAFRKLSPPPVRYHVSCAADPSRTFQTERKPEVAAAPFTELVTEWHKVNGMRPQGAPVGITVASDGAIWLVEDTTRPILRIDTPPASQAPDAAAMRRQDAHRRSTNSSNSSRATRKAPAADDDPQRAGRKALRRLPFGLRLEAGSQREQRRTRPCCVSCCRRMAGCIPAIPNPAGCIRACDGIGAERLMPPRAADGRE